MPEPATVHLCRKCKGRRKLAARLDEEGVPVVAVRCQDVCSGPVALVVVDGTWTTFRRVRAGRQRAALARLARRGGRGPVPRRLEELVVRRRTGRAPRPKKGTG